MSDTLRVGLIAEPAGWHLDGLINVCAEHPEVGEVAVADATGQVAGVFRPITGSSPDPHWQARSHEPGTGPPPGWTRYGREVDTPAILGDKLVASFTDYRRLLDEYKPDAVLVTMEPRKMPPVLIDCLEAGVHVFHEKPACGRIEDYRRVVEVANRSSAHLCVAFNMRGLAAVREARAVVQSGALGRLFGMQVHYVAEHPRTWLWEELADGWMYDRDRGGGHLIFLGCHYLDLMRYITGANVRQVAGFADNVGGEPINAEDAYAISLRFDNGMVGAFTGGFMTPSSQKARRPANLGQPRLAALQPRIRRRLRVVHARRRRRHGAPAPPQLHRHRRQRRVRPVQARVLPGLPGRRRTARQQPTTPSGCTKPPGPPDGPPIPARRRPSAWEASSALS